MDNEDGSTGVDGIILKSGLPSETSLPLKVLLTFGVAAGLYLSSLYSYNLFHTMVEIFSIFVGVSIFVIVWNTRGLMQNGYLLFLGIGFFFAAIIDLVHTLAYKGMGIFAGYDANLPTQLWIAARYMQSLSFLVAPLFFTHRPRLSIVIIVYAAISVIIFLSIFVLDIFPVCYVEGEGLTYFKITSEYVICLILLVSAVILKRYRNEFEPEVHRLLLMSIGVTIASEMFFTFYFDVYDFCNMAGHFLKVVAFYLVYKAVLETGLRQPYSLTFRELDRERNQLHREIRLREKLQEDVEVNAEKYRVIADYTYDWENWVDPSGKLVYVSPSCERITGYTVSDFMSNPDLQTDLIHPDDRQTVQSFFDAHSSTENAQQTYDIDYRIVRKDSEVTWINHICVPVFSDKGVYLGRRASNRDITDRKRSQEELLRSHQNFRLLVENSLIPMMIVDRDTGEIEYINPRFVETYGYTREEIYDVNNWLLLAYPDEEYRTQVCNEWMGRLKVALGERTAVQPLEAVVTCKDGSQKTAEWGMLPIDEKGIVHAIDLTERKRLEIEKQELQAQVFEARKLKAIGTMVGGLAHDFNNMLQIIAGYSQILMDEARPGTLDSHGLKHIFDVSMEAAELIRKLLALGQESLVVPEKLDLNDELRGMQAYFAKSFPESVRIEMNFCDEPAMIYADRQQIHIAVQNLVSNSAEAMPLGGNITISTAKTILDSQDTGAQPETKPGEYVLLTVRDTGKGIESDILPQIFDPFFTTKPRSTQRGTGLGLSVVRGIVQQMGGFISCSSEPGKGAEFNLYFPSIGDSEVVKTDAGAVATKIQ